MESFNDFLEASSVPTVSRDDVAAEKKRVNKLRRDRLKEKKAKKVEAKAEFEKLMRKHGKAINDFANKFDGGGEYDVTDIPKWQAIVTIIHGLADGEKNKVNRQSWITGAKGHLPKL